MEMAWSMFPVLHDLWYCLQSQPTATVTHHVQTEERWLWRLRGHLREWRHHEAEDGQEAQVDAGHVPPVLRAFPEPFPNPRGPVRAKGRQVSLSAPAKGRTREDSVCHHRLLESWKKGYLIIRIIKMKTYASLQTKLPRCFPGQRQTNTAGDSQSVSDRLAQVWRAFWFESATTTQERTRPAATQHRVPSGLQQHTWTTCWCLRF